MLLELLRDTHYLILGISVILMIQLLLTSLRLSKFSFDHFAVVVMTFFAAFTTWYYIIDLIHYFHQIHYTGAIFTKAWYLVLNDPAGWFWSSQLTFIVIAGVLWLDIQTRRYHLNYEGATFFSGFFGAASFALPIWLFYCKQISSQENIKPGEFKTSNLVLALILIALTTVIILKIFSNNQNTVFATFLVIPHLCLFLVWPARLLFKKELKGSHVLIYCVFGMIAITAFLDHITTFLTLDFIENRSFHQIYNAIFANSSRRSITIDLILTWALCIYAILSSSIPWKYRITLVLISPISSPATMVCLFSMYYIYSKSRLDAVRE